MRELKLLFILFQFFVVCVQSDNIFGESSFKCAACTSLTNEMVKSVRKIKADATVDVGSFRIDPNGNQKRAKIPLSKSESHITGLVENACSKLNKYILLKNSTFSLYANDEGQDSRHSMIMGIMKRTTKLQEVPFSTKKLIFKCESILEDFEEDIVKLLIKGEMKTIFSRICYRLTDYCNKKEISEYSTASGIFMRSYNAAIKKMLDDPTAVKKEDVENVMQPAENIEELQKNSEKIKESNTEL